MIERSNFGDNLLAMLPDAIGGVVGRAVGSLVADRLAAPGRLTERAEALARVIDPTILDDPLRFASFRREYKKAEKLARSQVRGDDSVATARRLAESEKRLMAASSGAVPQQSPQSGSGEIVITEDRIVRRYVRQMDTATKARFWDWAIKYQDDRNAYEVSHPGETYSIVAAERGMALDLLIKAPFLGAGSFLADNMPFVGTAKSGAQVYTGRDLVTGEPVNRWVEGGTLALSILPYGKTLGKAGFEIGERALGRTAAADSAVVTGGRKAIPNWDHDAAELAYDAIRADPSDVAAIARNTGMPEWRVGRIKDHVFFKEHQLDDGLMRFQADPEMANAWSRLNAGNHVGSDIKLLNHEIFESKFEGIFRTNYRTAHDAAIRSGRVWIPGE